MMCCLRAREMHLKVFVVCYLWLSPLRHTLYLTLALSRLAPALLISLTLFPESLVCSTPSTSGTGHMLGLLNWPGPHPASAHTCFAALLYSKLNSGRHRLTNACTHMHKSHVQLLSVCFTLSQAHVNTNAHTKNHTHSHNSLSKSWF